MRGAVIYAPGDIRLERPTRPNYRTPHRRGHPQLVQIFGKQVHEKPLPLTGTPGLGMATKHDGRWP
jgi:hypothetical protein